MKRHLTTLLLLVTVVAHSEAQWTTDTAINQVITAAASDQNQVKIVATDDGGFWVSWLDGIGTGWDVRLQKFDIVGNEVFGAGGLLVADRSFSSTQDYGLALARDGDALLAFRDDRAGGIEITAARITALGSVVWGSAGIALTSNAGFVAAPKITAAPDNGAVVSWTENASVRAQRLDTLGAPMWGAGVTFVPSVGSYSVADMRATGDGTILSMVHATGGFSSPRYLVAQRLEPGGASTWGTSPLPVFDGGSLQIGAFPAFTLDDAGGAVFAWYSTNPALQCFVQRIDAAGNELWPHNGVAVATVPGMVRVNPFVAFEAATDDVIVAWKEQNGSQSMAGVSLQRVDASGARLWTDAGATLVPVGPSGADSTIVLPGAPGGDVLVTWVEAPSFNADRVFGARIDTGGGVSLPRFDVSSTPSGKRRLRAATSAEGFNLITWSDARNDGGDIYAQALRADGTPGGADELTSMTCTGVPNSTGAPGELVATGSAAAVDNDVVLWATGLPAGSFGFFLTSLAGASVPQPGGSQGVLCLGGPIGRYVGPGQISSSGPGGVLTLRLDLTRHPTPTGLVTVMSGDLWYFQAWHRDANPAATSNFTGAASLAFQ